MRTKLSLLTICLATTSALAAPAEGELPGIEFPAGDTTAKAGEWVLTVNKLMYDKFAAEPDKKGVIFYSYQLTEPGPKVSKFKSMGKEDSAPNLLVIPLGTGAKAKVGDIVLTWWQSGSGMQRAIVVDAKDPKQPVVRYLDLDYNNPAKSRDNTTTIGQMDEQLKPDSFALLTAAWQPGTTVACKDGKDFRVLDVLRVSGDKVLTKGFVGKLAAKPKADCTPMPLKPKLKVGDKVQAKWTSVVRSGVVTKIDPKIGRVWVKFDKLADEVAVAYGHVIDKL
ncbi:MAG: hypothetical protein JNL83_17670 [Myxococcales bacterium]|nr:hypothetical protein [Myxococcales bacterium]